jgi:hypothetical protein
MKKKQWILLCTVAIPFLVSLVVTESVFSHGIPSTNNINPNILNGLVTLSGIVFAFQPVIFRTKKIFFYRYLFMIPFLLEGVFVGNVGYSFISDALNTGTFSGLTLYATAFSLFLNISYLVYFVFADLIVEMEDSVAF